MTPRSILVLEESHPTQGAITSALEATDVTIYHENQPEEFFRIAKQLRPDLIFISNSDHKQEYATCQQLKGDADLADTPLIVLAESRDSIDEATLVALKIDGFLRKPFEAAALQNQIQRFLPSIFSAPASEAYSSAQSNQEGNTPAEADFSVFDEEMLDLISEHSGEPRVKEEDVPEVDFLQEQTPDAPLQEAPLQDEAETEPIHERLSISEIAPDVETLDSSEFEELEGLAPPEIHPSQETLLEEEEGLMLDEEETTLDAEEGLEALDLAEEEVLLEEEPLVLEEESGMEILDVAEEKSAPEEENPLAQLKESGLEDAMVQAQTSDVFGNEVLEIEEDFNEDEFLEVEEDFSEEEFLEEPMLDMEGTDEEKSLDFEMTSEEAALEESIELEDFPEDPSASPTDKMDFGDIELEGEEEEGFGSEMSEDDEIVLEELSINDQAEEDELSLELEEPENELSLEMEDGGDELSLEMEDEADELSLEMDEEMETGFMEAVDETEDGLAIDDLEDGVDVSLELEEVPNKDAFENEDLEDELSLEMESLPNEDAFEEDDLEDGVDVSLELEEVPNEDAFEGEAEAHFSQELTEAQKLRKGLTDIQLDENDFQEGLDIDDYDDNEVQSLQEGLTDIQLSENDFDPELPNVLFTEDTGFAGAEEDDLPPSDELVGMDSFSLDLNPEEVTVLEHQEDHLLLSEAQELEMDFQSDLGDSLQIDDEEEVIFAEEPETLDFQSDPEAPLELETPEGITHEDIFEANLQELDALESQELPDLEAQALSELDDLDQEMTELEKGGQDLNLETLEDAPTLEEEALTEESEIEIVNFQEDEGIESPSALDVEMEEMPLGAELELENKDFDAQPAEQIVIQVNTQSPPSSPENNNSDNLGKLLENVVAASVQKSLEQSMPHLVEQIVKKIKEDQ